jgi:hypothetical protein
VVSFPQVSPPKPCIRLSSPPYVLRSPPISSFPILSPEQYWNTKTLKCIKFIKLINHSVMILCIKIRNDKPSQLPVLSQWKQSSESIRKIRSRCWIQPLVQRHNTSWVTVESSRWYSVTTLRASLLNPSVGTASQHFVSHSWIQPLLQRHNTSWVTVESSR